MLVMQRDDVIQEALLQIRAQVRLASAPLNELMALGIKRPAHQSTVPTWSLSDPPARRS
jgi:hypothetical protein